jgi:hypothetical protein
MSSYDRMKDGRKAVLDHVEVASRLALEAAEKQRMDPLSPSAALAARVAEANAAAAGAIMQVERFRSAS